MSSHFDISSFLETQSSSPPYVLDISSSHCHVQAKDLMTLPDSLLQKIISLVVNVSAIGDSPNTFQPPHHILSKVNHRFRNLVYSMPTFWTNISSSMTEHQVESYIRYSGQLCLSVNLSYTQGTNVTTFLRLFRQLCAHAHRWKRLSISIKSKHWKNDDNATAIVRGLCFIASDCMIQLPLLQTFQVEICAKERYGCTQKEEEAASFFKEWPIPVLCSVSVSGIIPRFDFARCLSSLDITLSTGHIFSLNSLRSLVTLLKNCPSLYRLQLKFVRSSIGVNLAEYIHPAFKEKVTIPNLALLALCYVENNANGQMNQAHQFQYILDSLTLPKLCACKIIFDAPRWFVIDGGQLFDKIINLVERSPELRTLHIDASTTVKYNLEGGEIPVVKIFRSLPRLLKLHVFDNHTYNYDTNAHYTEPQGCVSRNLNLKHLSIRDNMTLTTDAFLKIMDFIKLTERQTHIKGKVKGMFKTMEISGRTLLNRGIVESTIRDMKRTIVWEAGL